MGAEQQPDITRRELLEPSSGNQTSTHLTDEEYKRLIAEFQKGDPSAIAIVIDNLYPRVREVFGWDIAQECMIRLLQNIHEFDTRRSSTVKAYVYQIAARLEIDESRKWWKRMRTGLQDHCNSIRSSRRSPYDEFAQREQEARLLRLLSKLSQGDRRVITLRYLEECSCEETAQILNLSLESVTQKLSRALARVRLLAAKQPKTGNIARQATPAEH